MTSSAPDFPAAIDLGAHGGRVEPADDLVRQVQVPLIARRHLERRLDRIVEQTDRVVALEPRPQVVEDAARLLERRLGHLHGAEAPRQRLVFLDVFLVLAERRRADHAHFAAREHRLEDVGGVRRRAERRAGADHRVRLVDEQDQVRPLLDLADDVLDAVLEHAAQHRAGDHRVHLQVDHLAVAQPHRHGLRLELDAPRQPLDDRRLADARLADQHHRVRPLAVAEDLQHLLDLLVAAVDRRDLVLARQQIQVGGEVLEERRQLEALPQPLLAQLVVAHPGGDSRDEHLRLDAVTADDRDRNALAFLEDGREQVRRLDRLAAGAARLMERQLEHELGRRRDAQLAVGEGRQHLQMLLEPLQNLVRIQLEIAHDLRERVPLDLREREEDVFVGEQRVIAAPRFLNRAVDDPLGGFTNLALCDVEVVHESVLLTHRGHADTQSANPLARAIGPA